MRFSKMSSMSMPLSTAIILLCTVILLDQLQPIECKVAFQFPRYHYKKKPKVEKLFKGDWKKCDRHGCDGKYGADKTNCVRKCMAPACYDEIYGYDELEEGEIDIRGTSFKGCWRQKYHENMPKVEWN